MFNMVSICIATCNGEKYLYETLASIEQQSYTDFECIIVDDYSTDDTLYIAYSFAKRDKRFKVYVNTTDRLHPYTDAHNKSYEYAKGDLLFRIDQDDVLTNKYIETYVNLMTALENMEVDAISTYPIFYQMNNGHQEIIEFISKERMTRDSSNFNNEPLITYNQLTDSWFNETSCMRKKFFDEKHPKYTHAKRGDIVFWWNVLSLGGNLKTVPIQLLYQRHYAKATEYSNLYNVSDNENQFQKDLASYKQKAFENLYNATNKQIYLDCAQVFKNTAEYFKTKLSNNERF